MDLITVTIELQLVVLDREAFLCDSHARRFTDVANDQRLNFDEWLEFFRDPRRQQRLIDAQIHHQRPALAGVVIELEQHPAFKDFFESHSRDDTRRHRQAIGVIVKLVMLRLGWATTGKKGFLGGGHTGGLSQYFTKAEFYEQEGVTGR